MTTEGKRFSESFNHLLIKRWFYENIPLFNDVKTIKEEIKIGNRIADIYIELKNGKKVVIEIQHSIITEAALHQRTKEYNQNDVYVLWVLDGNGPYEKKYEDNNRTYNNDIKDEKPVTFYVSEKELQLMYKRRVYYINAGEQGIETPVYTIHFAPYFMRRKSRNGFIYYKKSKTMGIPICTEVFSLELSLFRNKGFKLASFLDKDSKSACIDDVVHYIDDFIAYRDINYNKFRKEYPKGLPLRNLIKEFSVKYGLYLLFDVLRYLKYLRVRDAVYMFIEKHSSSKYLQI